MSYQKEALRTLSDNFCVQEGKYQGAYVTPKMLHAIIGLATESNELLRVDPFDRTNAIEELGDHYWFAAVLCEELGIDFQEAIMMNRDSWEPPGDAYAALARVTDLMLNMAKKAVFYGTPVTFEQWGDKVGQVIGLLAYCCHGLCTAPAHVMERNLNKLKTRYPERFTSEAATVRDLEAEREALEGN